MFWGLIMEPNKRYTQVVEKPFHISQAAMDISTGDNDPCQVMVVVDGKNFLVCTLQKNKNIQVPLDLYFKSGDAISFLTNGKCNVHLTGYLDPEFEEEEESSEGEEEAEDEKPTLVAAAKRKLENSLDSEASKKQKNKKPVKAEESSDDDDDDDEDHLQKILDGEDLDSDENDESFKVNTTAEGDSDEEDSDDDEEAEAEEAEDDDDSSDEAETTLDTSKEEPKVDPSKLSKSARRRLAKKNKKEGKEQPQVNGVDKSKKEKPEQQAKPEKKKPESKKEAQNGEVEKKEKKTISGGVSIEDIKVGNGPAAKPGKNVMVYYEGRLKQNNKMFDNCMKGPGFKFRLGAKEVITGWDVGISGMKVGGKRKIICPPNMAYGAKGSPPVIPPNSTLVFEVELKNVK
ncbi:46 kDa FK506-binding nuclear protein-like isoform X2 [Choristoneura fumiferana]|uniref:46 kDa FK506-binding nuclear protein-like isoform X2 n=1 Tax=Choristoneura fumiferana TaxID=7141 RepID=UPI003D157290